MSAVSSRNLQNPSWSSSSRLRAVGHRGGWVGSPWAGSSWAEPPRAKLTEVLEDVKVPAPPHQGYPQDGIALVVGVQHVDLSVAFRSRPRRWGRPPRGMDLEGQGLQGLTPSSPHPVPALEWLGTLQKLLKDDPVCWWENGKVWGMKCAGNSIGNSAGNRAGNSMGNSAGNSMGNGTEKSAGNSMGNSTGKQHRAQCREQHGEQHREHCREQQGEQ